MLIITGKNVLLRDFIVSDIDDYIIWNTTCTEWMDWDAPWENESSDSFDQEAYKNKKIKDINIKKDEHRIRTKLELCLNDELKTHIGWVSAYKIDSNYKFTTEQGDYAIGIDIPEPLNRGNGHGKEALNLYINYLRSKDITTIYTQTWSGNKPMIFLAKKLGFIECHRNKKSRLVKNCYYDGLTFKLNSNYNNLDNL